MRVTDASAVAPMRYPFGEPPETGSWREVRTGLFWLRQRLPFDLAHINVYALVDDDGWSAIDTGINSRQSKAVWERFTSEVMNHRRPRELIVTHLHPDHVGLAGWFARELHAPLRMSRTEYLHCRILVADTGRPAPPEGIEFYRAAGMDDASLERYRKDFGGFGRMVAPLPESYHRLVDGDELQVGDHVWSVVVGCGHSPEHVCLYDRGRNIMLSGDQLLPKISSNVGVWPTEPDANPLDDWLRSCRKLKETIDDETLVCPAHASCSSGGPGRLQALIDGHDRKLGVLMAGLTRSMRATDVAQVMFAHVEHADRSLLAVGETISHLNYLMHAGAVTRHRKDGINWYAPA